MERRLWERVRWGNVARAAGVVVAVAVIVAWPVLAPEAPRVPGGGVVPVGTPAAPVGAAPHAMPRRKRPVVRRERRAGDGGGSRRVVRRRKRPVRRGERRAASRRGARRPGAPVVRGERRAGEGGEGAGPGARAPAVVVAPPAALPLVPRAVPVVPPAAVPVVPRAVPVVPPAAGAPAPPDPDPVVREFSFEAG